MSRLMPSQFPSKRWLISLTPPSVLLLSTLHGIEYLLHQFGSPSWQHLFPPSSLHPARSLVSREREVKKAFRLFKHCSAAAKIPAVLITNPKHTTIWAAVKKINAAPARPNTAF